MDSKAIQKRVNEICKAMTEKGLREADVQFTIEAHKEEVRVYLKWKDVTKSGRPYAGDHNYEFIRAEEIGDAFKKADDFIAALPSAAEAKLQQFMGALANVIDLGKDNGIEVEFLNPLQATMKKLSDNILTDQRAA